MSRPAAPDSPEDRETMRRDFERGVYEREKVESETPKADNSRSVYAEPELLDYWRTLPAPSNERLAVEIIETLQRELQQWTRWGIVEISVRNSSVADYCAHWEGRAEKAAIALSLAQTEIKGHMRDATRYRFIRNLLAIEDVERLISDGNPTPDEQESLRTDAAIDAALKSRA